MKQIHTHRTPGSYRFSTGFSLIELMVAMVIGIAASLIIMQMFSVSEGRKRTSTSGADAQTNAAIALYLMERDIRQAGLGLAPNTQDFSPIYTPPPGGVLSTGILAQCTTVRAYKADRAGTANFSYTNSTFAPLVIDPPGYPAGDTNTHVILVNYGGNNGIIGNGIDITQSATTTQPGGDGHDYLVSISRAGFKPGDMILTVPPATSGLDCTLGEVTGLPGEPAPSGQCAPAIPGLVSAINHNNLAYKSFYTGCTSVNAVWNASGAGINYTAGSRLYNLGPSGGFVSRAYAVRNGSLTMCDMTATDCTKTSDATAWLPIAPNIVALSAQYGKDTDFNGTIDAWNTVTPLNSGHAQVVAVRLALVARSDQYEKTSDHTATAPVWHKDASGTSNTNLDISSSVADWERYRYRIAQSVVPLRNMMWGEQK